MNICSISKHAYCQVLDQSNKYRHHSQKQYLKVCTRSEREYYKMLKCKLQILNSKISLRNIVILKDSNNIKFALYAIE